MTAGHRHPRSNKTEADLRAPLALAARLRASCSLQWPRARAAESPAPNPARKCEAARGAAHAPPLWASAQNFESVHVKLSLPFQRGTELWETLGSDDCGGGSRLVFFFSSTFFFPPLSSVPSFWLLSFPPPPRSRLVPRPVSPPLVYAICWRGVTEGDVLFSPEAQREGGTSTLERTTINPEIRTHGSAAGTDTWTSGSPGDQGGRR